MKFFRRKPKFFAAWAFAILGLYFCVSDFLHPNTTIVYGEHEADDGRPSELKSTVYRVSQRHGVDPDLVWAVMKAESNFNPHARSPRGARGLMQLMPGTARQYKVADLHDPTENIKGGVRYLRTLMDRFEGNVRLAVAAYNAGPTIVERYRDIPPYSETRNYVRRVFTYYQRYNPNAFPSTVKSHDGFVYDPGMN